jgi:hypothetical protein
VDDGALMASFRRRPTVRGPLGTVKIWAAAIVGAAVTSMIMAMMAASQPTCAEGELDCILYGGCGPKLQLAGGSLYAACVPTRSHDCRQSMACQLSGRCELVEGECRATQPHHCRRSLACEVHGRCAVDGEGTCVDERGPPEGWMGSPPSKLDPQRHPGWSKRLPPAD